MHPPDFGPSLETIDAGQAGQRIDNFLFTRLKRVPKSHVYRLLRKGEVRVNKKRIKPDYRLQANDIVRLPPVKLLPERPRIIDHRMVERLEQCILYENEHMLVLNKPSGIAVHAGSGVDIGVIEALRASHAREGFLELAHRIDRETSGCLLIAKERATLLELHRLLREEGMTKRYLALVVGRWEGGERIVDAPLEKFELESGERMVKVRETGQEARTIFKPLQQFENFTLVQAEPQTGRTHQIRVHALHIGHPIAGDDKYGDREINKSMRAEGLNRLFLHAAYLAFPLPNSSKQFEFKAELDEKLQAVLERLV